MKDNKMITITLDGATRSIDPSRIDYVEFKPPTDKKKASALLLFQSGEVIELKGAWAELLQRQLEGEKPAREAGKKQTAAAS